MDVKVPDIGDFTDIPVVTVLVSVGDTVSEEDPLIELESDKATMEVPSPSAGKITEIKVKEGDTVSEGDVIMVFEGADANDAPAKDATGQGGEVKGGYGGRGSPPQDDAPQAVQATGNASGKGDVHAEVVVLGSGPGGYSAAFRAADLGKSVVLIEKYPDLGGVCLNVGCIPSKALLHVAKVIDAADHLGSHGVRFGAPEIDLDALRDYKNGVVSKLTGGLAGMANKRGVEVIHGRAEFSGSHALKIEQAS